METNNKFLNGLKKESNFTTTENGAVALNSTLNYCLDAFGSLGGMMHSNSDEIISIFSKAFSENRETAMKLLFYMRDIRGGQGMRSLFRIILKWLADYHSDYVNFNLDNILKFGRGDDILCLFGTPCEQTMTNWAYATLKHDYRTACDKEGDCSLLAKWMPSENTSSKETREMARKFIKAFNFSPKTYRQRLSKIRSYLNIVERDMSANKWNEINYSALPAKASMKYSDAFFNHDEERYSQYISDISNGSAKVNAASLFPVNIVAKLLGNKLTRKDVLLYDAMWKALPNYFEGKEETGICVVDTSGSMTGEPMNVAISLGMYCADKCKGPFKNHFITFSDNPKLQEIVGSDIYDKVRNISKADWNGSTNLEAVFDLILRTAVANNCSDEEMPKKLYIVSDMQFNEATSDFGYYLGRHREKKPFMASMKDKYIQAGYTMPSIVYWNVRESFENGMFQDTYQGENCCMVSGYSPSLFKAIIEGTTLEEEETTDANGNKQKVVREKLDPLVIMTNTLNNERYNSVWVG